MKLTRHTLLKSLQKRSHALRPRITVNYGGRMHKIYKLVLDDPEAFAGIGENLHFEDFSFAVETGQNFK